MAGIETSDSTIQRMTDNAGQRPEELLPERQTPGTEEPWGVYQDTSGNHVGDISLDATGDPQQGPPAESAEGRIPYVGMLANPPPAGWEDKHPA